MPTSRQPCDGFEYTHQPFLLKHQTFNQQFSHLYNARLDFVHAKCKAKANTTWPGVPVARVVNLVDGKESVIIGALYKNMESKPDFLQEYVVQMGESERITLDQEAATFHASPDDTLSLEDQSGRVALVGDALPVGSLCTGLIVVVKGKVSGKEFRVEEWAYPPLDQQPPRRFASTATPSYVGFISGLGFGGVTPQQELQLDAVSSFLRGNLGCEDIVRNITKLVVAGGLVAASYDTLICKKIKLETADHETMNKAPLADSMALFDAWLTQVSEAVPVDVMPAESDPTNAFLPYQPIHPCLLPQAFSGVNTSLVTSPFSFTYRAVPSLGTSGENLSELRTYTLSETNPALLGTILRSGMLAPTAPDTLQCYPFKKSDPFQFATPPRLLFAGNSTEFSTELLTGDFGETRVVSVPKFTTQPGITLVDYSSEDLATLFIPIDVTQG